MQIQHPPKNTPGSFVRPEVLAQHLETQKKQALPPPEDAQIVEETTAKTDAPAPLGQDDPKKAEEEKKYQDFLIFKKDCEESLGIEITEEDIRTLIFQSRMKKELVIIPGILNGVFHTLQGAEMEEIDVHMANWRDRTTKDKDGKEVPVSYTQQGLEDERAKTLLSYAWLTSFEVLPDKKRDRPLGAGVHARRKTLDSMGAHIILAASEAWNKYELFVRVMLQEKKFLKKS